MESDKALIDACLAGRSEVYGVLVRRHQQRVFNVLYRLLGNYEASQDISQEAFLVAYNKLDTFGGKSAFSTWLCQIALNKARDMLRSNKSDKLNEDLVDYVDILAAPELQRPDFQAEQGQLGKDVQRILNIMPFTYREVLILKHLEEFSNEEIASLLNETIENVKVRTFRARQMFKKLYGE